MLLVLNGIIKLRYKDYHGLSRNRNFSPETTEPGVEVDIDVQGQRVYTASRDIKARVVIGAGSDYFRDIDKQPLNAKKMWTIAMNTPSVARALYYYANAKPYAEGESGYLFNVLQEMEDDGGRNLPQWKPKEEETFRQWAHNAHISGGKARHPLKKSATNRAQAVIQSMPSSDEIAKEAREFIDNLLVGWIQAKP